MKYFIGRVPRELKESDFVDYFTDFGRVESVVLHGAYGFLTMSGDEDPIRLTDQKFHRYNGFEFIVEKAKSQEPQYGSRNEPRSYQTDYRDNYRGGRFYRGDERGTYMMDGYGMSHGYRYDEPRYMGGARDECICHRCPIHGVRRMSPPVKRVKGHPKDAMKMVCDNVLSNPSNEELYKFAQDNNLKPVFVKLSRNGCAIFEFDSIEEKDEAMKRLDRALLNGDTIKTRSYMVGSTFQRDESYRRPTRTPDNEGGQVTTDVINSPKVDAFYNDSEDARNDLGETKAVEDAEE